MSVLLLRGGGHPWSASPDWDQMTLGAPDAAVLALMVRDAERKHWQVWINEPGRLQALLYKPAGAVAAWRDDQRRGTDRARCLAIEVGDEVYTDFAGRITRHRVTERQTRETSGHVSQTDCQLRVTPPVPGSGYVAEPGAVIRQKGLAWMDCAWFRPA